LCQLLRLRKKRSYKCNARRRRSYLCRNNNPDDSDAVAEDETLPNLPDGFHEVNLNDSEYE